MKNENAKNIIVLLLTVCLVAAVGFFLIKAAVSFDWPEPVRTPERREPAAQPPAGREPYPSAMPESFGTRETPTDTRE